MDMREAVGGGKSMKEVTEHEQGEFREHVAKQREHWLGFICGEDECRQILKWLWEEGMSRPDGYEDRMRAYEKLRGLGNEQFAKGDYRRALHCELGAVHMLDFTPNQQLKMTEAERKRSAHGMMTTMSNLTLVFLRRGDLENAVRVAGLGLRTTDLLPAEETVTTKAKLLYRRALARGERGPSRDLEKAYDDLESAAKMVPSDPEIRKCLVNCKRLLKKERRAARLGEEAEDEEDEALEKTSSEADHDTPSGEASGWLSACSRRAGAVSSWRGRVAVLAVLAALAVHRLA